MKSLFKEWVPVAVWLGMIFLGSSDLMSTEHTSRFIGPFLHWLIPEVSGETIRAVQLFVRKAAHLTEYAILAALILRALRAGTLRAVLPLVLAVLVAAAACAALDEYHQSFIASRTASPVDVLIDVCGAIIGLSVYFFLFLRGAPMLARAPRA